MKTITPDTQSFRVSLLVLPGLSARGLRSGSALGVDSTQNSGLVGVVRGVVSSVGPAGALLW